MTFNKLSKEIIAVMAGVIAVCLVLTAVPRDFSSQASDEVIDTENFNIITSAGAIASIGKTEDTSSAGASGAVNGTVGIVDNDNNQVGKPSDEEPEVVYETFGYTNLGLAKVEEGNLNVRKSPTTNSSVVGKLTNHAACEIVGEENGWYKITSGNVEGYVSAEYVITGEEALIIAQTEAREMATVLVDSLRVRQGPSTDHKKLSTISKGEDLVVLEILDGWVKVEFSGYESAYLSLEYVKIEKKLKTGNTMDELRFGQGVSDLRVNLVNFALQWVGGRYVWGGNSLKYGVDCSGFTQQVYKHFGISIPRTSYTQPSAGRKISPSQAKPGDLFFYYGDNGRIGHVAIYIGGGKIVHASSPTQGIIISNAYYSTPACVCTYLD